MMKLEEEEIIWKKETWKAEEAVPKTKPLGKLPLEMFVEEEESEKHMGIPHTISETTITTTIAKSSIILMPLLLILVIKD